MNKEKNNDNWVVCPECKTKIKQKNLSRHLKNIHGKTIKNTEESLEKTIAKKQQVSWFSTRKIIAIVTIAIVVLAPTAYLLMAMSSVGNRNNDSISTLPQCTTLNPLGSSVSTSTELSVEFSEPMNKSSVEAAFSTSPEINGSFSWNENTLIFTPSDLLNKGTCSITCGINPYFFQD